MCLSFIICGLKKYIYIYVHKQLTVTSISNDIPLLLLLVYHINNTTTGFELTLLRLHDLIGFVYIRDANLHGRSFHPSLMKLSHFVIGRYVTFHQQGGGIHGGNV